MQLFKLFPVSKIQGQVCSNDGFPDDLKYLLIFTGAQIGEDIVPFQLWKSKNPIKSTSSNSEMISVFTSPDRLEQFYSPTTIFVAKSNIDSLKFPFLSFLFKYCHETYD